MSDMEKILVLQGGRSGEREVSLRSAAGVVEQLKTLGYEVTVADPAAADFELEQLARDCDVVLPIIHGADGEDGVFQKRLEAIGKPFLGSGSAACELTFDKSKYREFMVKRGVRMAQGEVVDHAGFKNSALSQKPYVLKPVDGGSSVDMVIAHTPGDTPDETDLDELFTKYSTMLLEELIEGQELTVGVLDNQVLPVILIVPPADEEFDYENKYNGRTQEIVDPSEIPNETKQKAQELALCAHQLTGCRHLSRTDMILGNDSNLYVLETNTLPGMTSQSLFPKAAAAAGYDMRALVKCFVTLAKRV